MADEIVFVVFIILIILLAFVYIIIQLKGKTIDLTEKIGGGNNDLIPFSKYQSSVPSYHNPVSISKYQSSVPSYHNPVSIDDRVLTGGNDQHHAHQLGDAMYKYALTLNESHVLKNPITGGDDKKTKTPVPKKPWNQYDTWEDLFKDEGAAIVYLTQRIAVLNNPDLNWEPVLVKMRPKLLENREYIGIVNIEADGKTLRLEADEASPINAGESGETVFASIPSELVAKFASRPALFIFHTHPSDPRANQLPSAQDLSTSIIIGSTSRFAANAVISSYGVIVYGPDLEAVKVIVESKNWTAAVANFSFDVLVAYEAKRSWSKYKISDVLDFYSKHRMYLVYYPSSLMVGDMYQYSYLWNLETPIDLDVIIEHANIIIEQRSKLLKK